jgi:predicted DNA-binding transcriptional regulator YafY
MAKYGKDAPVKSFGLDRISELETTKEHFVFPTTDNIEEKYRYCFGIISPDDEELQDIVLSFDPVQGKYIKSLPLHHTQQIIIDNEEELQVKLKLYITHDFVMELLSFSDNMKVLQPTSLAHTLRDYHKKAYLQYK